MAHNNHKTHGPPWEPIGRPSKLNDQLIDDVCQLIGLCVPPLTACQSVGIDRSTYYSWRARGRKERFVRGSLYAEFLERTTRARAQGLALLAGYAFNSITDPKINGAQALRMLVKRDPEHWSESRILKDDDGDEADDTARRKSLEQAHQNLFGRLSEIGAGVEIADDVEGFEDGE